MAKRWAASFTRFAIYSPPLNCCCYDERDDGHERAGQPLRPRGDRLGARWLRRRHSSPFRWAELGEAEGFGKTVFDRRTGELLGAHIIGPDATGRIHAIAIAGGHRIRTEVDSLPHPTLSEATHESVLHAFGRAIHI
ncbi:hypothetical protein [Consotaella aegiceratis]|uniref:hypothetical protein n=1 Tax=Consotaella aegiceratis TaxID=3097961 RepID=UPI003D803F14